jgi:hypothetical protein
VFVCVYEQHRAVHVLIITSFGGTVNRLLDLGAVVGTKSCCLRATEDKYFMTTKLCKSCNHLSPIDSFVKHSAWCGPCTTERARWRHIKATYGLTKDDYLAILESQQGRCRICGISNETNSQKYQFSVDHEHDNTRRRGTHDRSKIRGLLCNDCNSALGLFKDNLEILQNAINYLENHTG